MKCGGFDHLLRLLFLSLSGEDHLSGLPPNSVDILTGRKTFGENYLKLPLLWLLRNWPIFVAAGHFPPRLLWWKKERIQVKFVFLNAAHSQSAVVSNKCILAGGQRQAGLGGQMCNCSPGCSNSCASPQYWFHASHWVLWKDGQPLQSESHRILVSWAGGAEWQLNGWIDTVFKA